MTRRESALVTTKDRTPQSARSDEASWLAHYFARYRTSIFQEGVVEQLVTLKQWMLEAQADGNKVILAGNGGSAAIASHSAVDFTKNAKIRCINFNEADLITCFANDYGYEWWLQKAIEHYVDAGDLIILISSSGKSPNMINAARFVREQGLKVVTFTGFAPDNPLKTVGHLNVWVNSRAYNVIEMTHHIWLLAVCDLIIGNAEYPARSGE